MPTPPCSYGSDGSVHEGRSVDPRDAPLVPVDDWLLEHLTVDYQVRFQFEGWQVAIDSPFTALIDGETHELDPEDRAGLGPVLALYPGVLRSLGVDADGTLHLYWVSGAEVVVPPDPRFEAWDLCGPGERRVICDPGGRRLSVWD